MVRLQGAGQYVSNVANCRPWRLLADERQLPALTNSHIVPIAVLGNIRLADRQPEAGVRGRGGINATTQAELATIRKSMRGVEEDQFQALV